MDSQLVEMVNSLKRKSPPRIIKSYYQMLEGAAYYISTNMELSHEVLLEHGRDYTGKQAIAPCFFCNGDYSLVQALVLQKRKGIFKNRTVIARFENKILQPSSRLVAMLMSGSLRDSDFERDSRILNIDVSYLQIVGFLKKEAAKYGRRYGFKEVNVRRLRPQSGIYEPA